jgi:uncharacterized membrane protein
MKKRGPIVMIVGTVIIVSAMVIANSVIQRLGPNVTQGGFFPSPESMFDEVSEKETIEPGTAYTFSHTTTSAVVPLMWGLYITDYKPNDRVLVSVSNIFGDKFGSYQEGDPIFIKSFMIPKVDTYSFYVENKGSNSITVKMMYSENPEKSKAFSNPNSPFYQNIIPLATSGFLLIIGIIVIISGIVLSIMDWKRGKNQSRYI